MRHSCAHILATAVQHLRPEAKFGVGPVVENGFYYDIDLGGGQKTIRGRFCQNRGRNGQNRQSKRAICPLRDAHR